MDIQTIKKIKKVYDIDIIFNLKLINQKLKQIIFIPSFINLVSLNISYNDIEDLSILSNLKNLKILNASHNKIQKLNNIFNMDSLQIIDLENNQISSFIQISHLSSIKHFPSLTHLSFKSIDNQSINPICNDPSYFEKICDIFSDNRLISIDHHRVSVNDIHKSINEILQRLRKRSNCDPDIKSWIPANYFKCNDDATTNPTLDLQFQMAQKGLSATVQQAVKESRNVSVSVDTKHQSSDNTIQNKT